MIAFSDPNDLLSYSIPPKYEDKHIDSRLCQNIINISVNVTPAQNVLGIEFTDPTSAHKGYYDDDRIINLIANGLSNENTEHPCRWIQTIK